jgi:hypothetical protein
MWGDERLLATINTHFGSADTLTSKIVAEVAMWRGISGPPEDDVTMIVVQCS